MLVTIEISTHHLSYTMLQFTRCVCLSHAVSLPGHLTYTLTHTPLTQTHIQTDTYTHSYLTNLLQRSWWMP